jgi:hypothetical protein
MINLGMNKSLMGYGKNALPRLAKIPALGRDSHMLMDSLNAG